MRSYIPSVPLTAFATWTMSLSSTNFVGLQNVEASPPRAMARGPCPTGGRVCCATIRVGRPTRLSCTATKAGMIALWYAKYFNLIHDPPNSRHRVHPDLYHHRLGRPG